MPTKKKQTVETMPHNQSWTVNLVATIDQVFHEIVPTGRILSMGISEDGLAVVDYQAACGCALARLVLGHPDAGNWLGINAIAPGPMALGYALHELANCEEIEYREFFEEEGEGGCPHCLGELTEDKKE